MKKIILTGLIIFWAYGISLAHLAGDIDKVVDGYLIDLGWDPDPLLAHRTANFSLNLVKPETQQVVEPEKVWVRISHSDAVIFSGTFAPAAGHVVFQTLLDKPDHYEIRARFENIESKTIETRFEVDVVSSALKEKQIYLGLILIVLEAGAFFVVGKPKHKKH